MARDKHGMLCWLLVCSISIWISRAMRAAWVCKSQCKHTSRTSGTEMTHTHSSLNAHTREMSKLRSAKHLSQFYRTFVKYQLSFCQEIDKFCEQHNKISNLLMMYMCRGAININLFWINTIPYKQRIFNIRVSKNIFLAKSIISVVFYCFCGPINFWVLISILVDSSWINKILTQ